MKLINKKVFTKAILNKNVKTFSQNLDLKILIYLNQKV